MSFPGAAFHRFKHLVSLFSLMTVFGLSSSAQEPGSEVKIIQPEDWTKLQTKFKEKSATLLDLRSGTADPKENLDAIDVAAQFYSYRVTWPTTQAVTNLGGRMDTAFTDFEKEIQTSVKAKSELYLKLLAEKMTKYCKDVMDNNSKAIARINCARMLARLAEAGLDETADVLIDEVNKMDQFEAVKYYAIRGLRALIGAASQPKATVFAGPKGLEKQAKALQALVAIVDRKPPVLEALTPEEINGFRKVRLLAIEGLASFRKPAVLDEKGNPKIPVARTLLEVVKKEGMVPEPRLEEQVSAAVGLANMQAKGFPSYQPSFAALQVAPFCLEFAVRYQDKSNGGRDAKEPWKVYAARLIESLENFRRENVAANDLTTVIDQFLPMLKAIEADGQVNPGELKQWLADHPPKAETSLFKGIPDAKVKDVSVDEKDKAGKPEPDKKRESDKK